MQAITQLPPADGTGKYSAATGGTPLVLINNMGLSYCLKDQEHGRLRLRLPPAALGTPLRAPMPVIEPLADVPVV